MPDFLTVVSYLSTAGAGALAVLVLFKDKTKTKVDDKLYAWISAILPLLPKDAPKPPVEARPRSVDHRKQPR